ncbi:hypothetical protein SAMN05444274_102522 [Mariniphaga anaerophila]|uniref:Uncharacterized protein n=1 Tax=Mariniphaga anaerophila TaxID=1484053 RepID=A0A1M4WQ38_9BACT|nr:hypothetical protein SAMN05444274_102522 [Mariniphaga anaerophila]
MTGCRNLGFFTASPIDNLSDKKEEYFSFYTIYNQLFFFIILTAINRTILELKFFLLVFSL